MSIPEHCQSLTTLLGVPVEYRLTHRGEPSYSIRVDGAEVFVGKRLQTQMFLRGLERMLNLPTLRIHSRGVH